MSNNEKIIEQIKRLSLSEFSTSLSQLEEELMSVPFNELAILKALQEPESEDDYPSVEEISEAIDIFAPWALAESWDPTGFQIGRAEQRVKRVYMALDLTRRATEDCKNYDVDLLITHHPVLFSPTQELLSANTEQMNILDLVKSDISMISAHTNLDRALYGTAVSMIASFLGDYHLDTIINHASVLQVYESLIGVGHGRIWELDQNKSFSSLINQLKSNFRQNQIWARPGFGRDFNSEIKRIAFCPGAFSEDFLPLIKAQDIDLVVSGEVKHHLQLAINDLGIDLAMLNHDVSERVVMPFLLAHLRLVFPTLVFALDRGIDYTLGTSN